MATSPTKLIETSRSGRRSLVVLPPNFEDLQLPTGIFSHSQYSLYKKCGKAYEFKYVQNFPVMPRGVMFKGTTIHKGQEFSLQRVVEEKGLPPADESVAHVADAFDEGKLEVEKWDENEDAGKAKDAVIKAYTTLHKGALPRMHPKAVEWGFAIKVGTVPVQGYIDLIDRVKEFEDAGDPGRDVVADLKYSRKSKSQTEADKAPQFTLYSLATKIPEVRIDNLVELAKGAEFKQKTAFRTTRDHAILIEDFEETADLIKKGVFPMAPIDSWQCSPEWCDYWGMCRGRYREEKK